MNKNLTMKQAEQLIILIEECAEVQKCATKLLRFGIDNEYTGLDDLRKELGDLFGIIEWITKEFDIDPDLLIQYAKSKQTKMKSWTTYQNETQIK